MNAERMRLHCHECGKALSSPVSKDTLVRGIIICPECVVAPESVWSKLEAAEARVAALEGVMERVADARLADVLLAFDGDPFAWAQTELAAALAGERGADDA